MTKTQMELLGEGDEALEVTQYQANCVRIFADAPELLDEEFKTLPANMGYWGERYAVALRAHLEAKARAKLVRARTELTARESLRSTAPIDAKGKPERITEGVVGATVEAADEVQEADADERIAEVEKERVRLFLDALRAKRDCIVQLGAQHRAEMQHDPSIATRARDFRDRDGKD